MYHIQARLVFGSAVLLLSALMLLGRNAFAEAKSSPPASSPPSPATRPAVIEAGDRLCIGVAGLDASEPESLKTVRVSTDGTVGLYFVGVVKLGGMAYGEAERTIAKAYTERGVVRDAAITVNWMPPPQGLPAGESIAVGDRVSVKIFDLMPHATTSRVLTINLAGAVGVPSLGQVAIAGLSEAEAEKEIGKRYSDKGILREPQVSVLRLAPNELTEPTVDPTPVVSAPPRPK